MPRAAIFFFHITVRLIYLIREKEKGGGKGKGQGKGDRDVAGQGYLPVATIKKNRLYLNFLVIFTS